MKFRIYKKRIHRFARMGQLQIKRCQCRSVPVFSKNEDDLFERADTAYGQAIEAMWSEPPPKWKCRLISYGG